MNKKLFVANLKWTIGDDDLKTIFSKIGQEYPVADVVSAGVVINKDTGKSKGFGFVEFKTEQEAGAAINYFNGREVKGRALTVKEALPDDVPHLDSDSSKILAEFFRTAVINELMKFHYNGKSYEVVRKA